MEFYPCGGIAYIAQFSLNLFSAISKMWWQKLEPENCCFLVLEFEVEAAITAFYSIATQYQKKEFHCKNHFWMQLNYN